MESSAGSLIMLPSLKMSINKFHLKGYLVSLGQVLGCR